MRIVNRTIWLAGWVAILSLTASCAKIPAKLDRTHMLGGANCEFHEVSLHGLIEVALETPNEGRSAHALGHVVEVWRQELGNEMEATISPAQDSRGDVPYRVRFTTRVPATFLPGYFDELNPAVDFRVKRIEHHRKDGVGAPLRAFRENLERAPVERHYPPEGITREVTAILHRGAIRDGVRHLELELRCALYHENVRIEGKPRTMAADYSVALAALLERAGNLKKSEVGDLFTASPDREPNLYLMEPYDPRKEPLIMIHGLLDSPLAWAELTNALRSVPEVRQRYQIWHFLYNTSAPALYSGRLLRTQLREMRREFDPGRSHPASRKSTLLTHSMGGIVARGLITDPGNAFWEAGFTRPMDSLILSAEDRATLQEAFFWKPDPTVRRVIFIAVPHRGSNFADNPIGRLGRSFVQPPGEFRAFYERVSRANPGAFTEAYAELGSGKLDSVSALSPRQPTLQILPELPLGYPVDLHSIIGNRGRKGPLEKSSDGVVPYWSSHIEGVRSEKIIASNHGALDEEETIEEVKRILQLP